MPGGAGAGDAGGDGHEHFPLERGDDAGIRQELEGALGLEAQQDDVGAFDGGAVVFEDLDAVGGGEALAPGGAAAGGEEGLRGPGAGGEEPGHDGLTHGAAAEDGDGGLRVGHAALLPQAPGLHRGSTDAMDPRSRPKFGERGGAARR